ncbi:methyltransferase domain-containing protein [Geomonas sp. RF6]|uniref:class I SAM-dependent methyltransferase n=1 Tax=Geomonas sp. RF6 TaxID=2897342 RepID=UPI001E555249|nr:methyltransferase domain-containing protein [Geomonas sp. RF6]UFS69321.1 methyltransferase domain-containing protein [Geomonas sp. RF6]
MKGKSYERFRVIAPYYDAGVKALGVLLGGERGVRERVLDLLPVREGDHLLEVGCGTGTVTLMAASRVGRNGTVVGIDPSREMLARAERKLSRANSPEVRLVEGAGAPLPFPDQSFDSVIFFLVLHEMAHEDRIDSLKEALRILKPGGHLLVGELDRPPSATGRALLRILLLVEEEEASDFLRRALPSVMREGCGERIALVKRISFLGGLAQGVLYRKM